MTSYRWDRACQRACGTTRHREYIGLGYSIHLVDQISGLADSEIWEVPLPSDLAPGRYSVLTGLYRLRDQERVPASNADGSPWLDNRVPLGSVIIGDM